MHREDASAKQQQLIPLLTCQHLQSPCPSILLSRFLSSRFAYRLSSAAADLHLLRLSSLSSHSCLFLIRRNGRRRRLTAAGRLQNCIPSSLAAGPHTRIAAFSEGILCLLKKALSSKAAGVAQTQPACMSQPLRQEAGPPEPRIRQSIRLSITQSNREEEKGGSHERTSWSPLLGSLLAISLEARVQRSLSHKTHCRLHVTESLRWIETREEVRSTRKKTSRAGMQ